MAKSEKLKREARRTRRTLIGAAVLLFMAIGVFSIIGSATGIVRNLLDDTEEREYYADFITPLVLLDPLPFDSLASAPQNTLRQAAIWLAISKEDTTTFERDEFGSLYLPSAVVDNWALTLFGPEYSLTHETFVDSGLQFRYDELKQSYVIPITSQPINFIPEVLSMENDGDLKYLTVGYKLPAGSSIENVTGDTEPVKYLEYILKQYGNGFYIHAIGESELKPEQSDDSQTQTTQPGTTTPQPSVSSENILDQAIIEQEIDDGASLLSSVSGSSAQAAPMQEDAQSSSVSSTSETTDDETSSDTQDDTSSSQEE